MEVVGKLYQKGEAIKRTETFTVRDFVIEIENQRNPQWNDLVQFQAVNERVTMLDVFNIGEMLQVTFDIRGRKWKNPEGREIFFNTLNAWKIERYNGMPAGFNPTQANYGYPQNNQYVPNNGAPQQPYGAPQQPFAEPQQQTYQQPAPAQPEAQQPQEGFGEVAKSGDDLPF